MSDGTGTDWLRNCPTACYLLAAAIGAFAFMHLMDNLGFILSAIIGLVILFILGAVIRMLFCKKMDEAMPAAAMATPAAPAATKPAAKKPAAKKPAAKKAAAPKTTAKKPAAKRKTPALYTKKPAKVDDLKLISGVGPKLEKTCNSIGVWQFEQIAGWNKKDIAMVDDKLSFKGRIERDNWVGQAKKLAKAKK